MEKSTPVRIPRLPGMPSLQKASFPRTHPQNNAANPRKQGKAHTPLHIPCSSGKADCPASPGVQDWPSTREKCFFSPKKQRYFFLHFL